MLFRKDMDPCCAYCQHAAPVNEREVLCAKRGPMTPENHCRAFRYDPFKRIPPRPAVLRTRNLTAADFSLTDP